MYTKKIQDQCMGMIPSSKVSLPSNHRSAYLYFWRPILARQQRVAHHKYNFGSEIQLEHFGLTELHATILGLDTDGKTHEAITRKTHRNDIDEVNYLGRSALSYGPVYKAI